MKVSFKNITMRPTLKGEAQSVDATDIVAEAVYQNATTLAEHKLAHRIDEERDGVELTDAEVSIIKTAIAGYKYYFQQAVIEAIGKNESKDH